MNRAPPRWQILSNKYEVERFVRNRNPVTIPVSNLHNLAYGWDSRYVDFKMLTFDLMLGKEIELIHYLRKLRWHLEHVFSRMEMKLEDSGFPKMIQAIVNEANGQREKFENTYYIKYELDPPPNRGKESFFRASLSIPRLGEYSEIEIKGMVSSHQIPDIAILTAYIEAIGRGVKEYTAIYNSMGGGKKGKRKRIRKQRNSRVFK